MKAGKNTEIIAYLGSFLRELLECSFQCDTTANQQDQKRRF